MHKKFLDTGKSVQHCSDTYQEMEEFHFLAPLGCKMFIYLIPIKLLCPHHVPSLGPIYMLLHFLSYVPPSASYIHPCRHSDCSPPFNQSEVVYSQTFIYMLMVLTTGNHTVVLQQCPTPLTFATFHKNK